MSKGNKIHPVRFNECLMDDIEDCMGRRNRNATAEEWTFSDFVRLACQEKVAHMERSRKRRPKKEVKSSVNEGVPAVYEG
jgi:hypothetical protein